MALVVLILYLVVALEEEVVAGAMALGAAWAKVVALVQATDMVLVVAAVLVTVVVVVGAVASVLVGVAMVEEMDLAQARAQGMVTAVVVEEEEEVAAAMALAPDKAMLHCCTKQDTLIKLIMMRFLHYAIINKFRVQVSLSSDK